MEILQLIFSQLKKIPRNYYLPILIGITGLGLFIYGFMVYFHKGSSSENITETQNSQRTEKPITVVKKVIVDIEGAIGKPGVYELPLDTRIKDAVIAAGGFSVDADKEYREKQINLANKISDGMKIYIPRTGEKKAIMGTSDSLVDTETNSDMINMNTASSQTLEKLPGIGPVTAGKIISNRPYNQIEELLTKKVVSKSVYEKIKDKVSI